MNLNKFWRLLLGSWALLLAGCAGVSAEKAASSRAAVIPPVASSSSSTLPHVKGLEERSTPVDASQRVVMPARLEKHSGSSLPAARMLATQARLQMEDGQWAAAAATLEHALRLEPRNPHLWSMLARVRYHQGQYGLAASLAARANAFPGVSKKLRADNEALIRRAKMAHL